MGRGSLMVGWILVGVVAFALRLADLSTRPFHTDEATNAYLLQELFNGKYRYRGHDHHGPLLYYASALGLQARGLTQLSQWDESSLRALSVGAGTLLVFLPLGFRRYLGDGGSLAAGALTAFAAPLVYYSGIFIHETLLLLCLGLFVIAFWRTRESGSLVWALVAGIAAGLALSTKETAALLLPAFALPAWWGSTVPARRQFGLALLALASCLVVVALLYSNFGRHPRDAFALFRATELQVNRGLGGEHAYPWWQYLSWFGLPSPVGFPWSGWLLGLGAVAAVCVRHGAPFVARTAVAVGTLMAFFFILPYKTPWLSLAGWLATAWLAGAAWQGMWHRHRLFALGTGLCALGLLWAETDQKTRLQSVELGNPLAYSPSSPDLRRLARDLASLASSSPAQENLLIQVVARDYWPLPWVLRRYPQTGYWNDPTPLLPEAVTLLGPEIASEPSANDQNTTPYALRPGVFIFLRHPRSS